MAQVIRSLALVLVAAAVARAGEETHRSAGGCVEELRAVLDLDTAQTDRLRGVFRDADNNFAQIRDGARSRGAEPTLEQLVAWQERIRDRIRNEVLRPQQAPKYEEWLAFKTRLGEEYDAALFGLPACTELKLKLGLAPEPAGKIRAAEEEGVGRIKAKLLELKAAGVTTAEIATAINELRKETILKMIDAVKDVEQRKLKDYIKTWLKPPLEKLTRSRIDQLEKVLKMLELGEGAPTEKIRTFLAAILWHREENDALRRELAKELLMALVRARSDAEMWTALHEYGALIEIHSRRIASIGQDVKESLTTKQIAKLVAEKVLE